MQFVLKGKQSGSDGKAVGINWGSRECDQMAKISFQYWTLTAMKICPIS